MQANELFEYLIKLHNDSTACGGTGPELNKIEVNFRTDYDSDIQSIEEVTEDLYNADDNRTLESIILVSKVDDNY